jgi:nanoRNase/pAp phosphatase (c-di-AMP/oligoRNAs hydrolase)
MIDHHLLSNNLNIEHLKIPLLVEMIGSATSLIARKFFGQGYCFNSKLSKILYYGMLMDIENRVIHKMTEWDYHVMDTIKNDAEIKDDSKLYSYLMKKLSSKKITGTVLKRL